MRPPHHDHAVKVADAVHEVDPKASGFIDNARSRTDLYAATSPASAALRAPTFTLPSYETASSSPKEFRLPLVLLTPRHGRLVEPCEQTRPPNALPFAYNKTMAP